MLSYRVFGLPRSGTTWVANWLTTDRATCWHDPCEWALPYDVERWAERRENAGISCTGLWLLHAWDPGVPTLCLDRCPDEVQESLAKAGLPLLPEVVFDLWDALPFRKIALAELLEPSRAEEVQRFLLPELPFNCDRHAQLARMNVQPSALELDRVRSAIAITGGLKCPG